MHRCGYLHYKGKNRGKPCERMTKEERCHKHKNCSTDKSVNKDGTNRLADDPVFADLAPAKNAGPKVKSSVFLVTFNRNKTLESMSDEDKKKFRDYIDFVMSKENLLTHYLKDTNGADLNAVIRNIDVERSFELSHDAGLLHAHVYINIQHNGHLTLNIPDMRALARKIFGENIHINVQATSDPTIGYLNYTRKTGTAVEL